METINNAFPWLELIDRPAFCVKDGIIVSTNSAAEHKMLRIGTDIREVVTEHRDAYETFESGCLYLTITAGDFPCNASVTRTKECDIFLIYQDADDDHLQTLTLAAQQLRIPLSNIMATTDSLLSELSQVNPDTQVQANQINRNLFQLLRIISNMSDAGSYKNNLISGMETVNITAIIDEIIEKTQTLSEDSGIVFSYTSSDMPIFGLANEEKLERAIYNLLSNALKFSPEGSTVDVKLTKSGNMATFTITNTNIALVGEYEFWCRYRREPAIEDNRFGLGLGMTLVSAVASAHGGTVLVDHPNSGETRVTMTIAIKSDKSGTVRTPKLRIGDYAGGRDKGLLEFSEILPNESYSKID